jgi:hypothetical protein
MAYFRVANDRFSIRARSDAFLGVNPKPWVYQNAKPKILGLILQNPGIGCLSPLDQGFCVKKGVGVLQVTGTGELGD